MREIGRQLLAFSVGILLFATACGRKPKISADIAVSIDGEEISYSQFEDYLRGQVEGQEATLEGAVLSRLFDRFLDGQLLIRLAIERGLVSRDLAASGPPASDPPANDSPEPSAPAGEPVGDLASGSNDGQRLRPQETGLDERRAVRYLLRSALDRSWTQEEIAEYYRLHRDDFWRPEEVLLRQILVHDQDRGVAALEALEAGQDFAQVAARFSQGPRAQLGGDQGRLAHEDLPPAFSDSIFDLEPGQVSDIVSADYGFLIFQVVERYPAEMLPMESVAEEIQRALARQHIDEQVDELMGEARERYNVRVFPTNFPFEYRGSYEN